MCRNAADDMWVHLAYILRRLFYVCIHIGLCVPAETPRPHRHLFGDFNISSSIDRSIFSPHHSQNDKQSRRDEDVIMDIHLYQRDFAVQVCKLG